MESSDIVLLLPSLMAYAKRGDTRQLDAAQKASEKAKLHRASSACLFAWGVKIAARKILAEAHPAGNEETGATLMTNSLLKITPSFLQPRRLQTAEVKVRNAFPWCPDDLYASQMIFDVISLHNALSGPGNSDQRFAHLRSIIHMDIGREKFGRGLLARNR